MIVTYYTGLKDAQGFKLFLRVAWEPFEEQFQPIETRFIDHTKIIVRLANVEHQILFKEENQYNQRGPHLHVCHISIAADGQYREKAQGDIEMAVRRRL